MVDAARISILKDLGFTDGEIKVYYALFELGETTVGPISKKSRVTHAKVYPILAKLIEKGLASHVIKENKKHFSATNPKSLLDLVDKRVRTLEEEKHKIKDLIPALLAKQKELEKVQYARVFEGIKGLKSLFIELFSGNKEKDCIRVFGLNEILKEPRFMSFFKFYHPMRRSNNVEMHLILNKNMREFVVKKWRKEVMVAKTDKIKLVDMTFPLGVFIFRDHVINIIADEKVTAFDIKSRQNAERYRKFFFSVWDKEKELL